MRRRPRRQLGIAVILRAELQAQPVRLLEVVPEDLLLLRQAFAGDALEPSGERLVQVRSLALGDRVVRGVTDQQVAEPVRVLARQQRPFRRDELAPDERAQVHV